MYNSTKGPTNLLFTKRTALGRVGWGWRKLQLKNHVTAQKEREKERTHRERERERESELITIYRAEETIMEYMPKTSQLG